MSDVVVPALDPDESNYAHCQVVDVLPIRAERFFDWYIDEPIENFMLGTPFVSPVLGCEPLPGDPYGVPGSERLIKFKDGTVARERILSTDFPNSYFYMPYAYDNPIRLFSDHAKGRMTALPEGDNARIVWDYAFHARNRLALNVVKLFVALDWKRNMANGLKVIKAHLAEHGPEKRIHEVGGALKVA
ncbi:hypothetical protein FQ775_17660 [Nitratireductor mangrovi]|uniref:SRPBCC family protein n=1 Tax=Nitratireductor mangrovi TaxID=2599600 RepID=A0A5B8L348_9HYPH|nr:hypothetical protein [Nitratireductor mangrovi]QDZ02060.1 hypothetical protein FQ775_17660 [Nitratireductor mangrovi]